MVKEREFESIRLESEQVAEFDYRPTHCSKTYRMVVCRKNLAIEKGESRLSDDIRYFFYITNDWKMTPQQIVLFANNRCNQENVIGQLKSGVNALRMPSDGLVSNWAYMVIAALAWNLKAWYRLVTVAPVARRDILRMEFKRFLGSFIQIPCQIVATGRRLIFRILTLGLAQKQIHILLPALNSKFNSRNDIVICISKNRQPSGARRRAGIGWVAAPRRCPASSPMRRIACVAAPCICPPGARAKMRTYFCANP